MEPIIENNQFTDEQIAELQDAMQAIVDVVTNIMDEITKAAIDILDALKQFTKALFVGYLMEKYKLPYWLAKLVALFCPQKFVIKGLHSIANDLQIA